MAVLGKYTLVRIGGVVVPAQMDSSLNFTSGILETTEISGANRFKTFIYDEKEADCSVNIQQSETIESSLYNAWYNSTLVTVIYGGINVGEKYYQFDAVITGISKSDPSNGISMLSVTLKPTGIIQRLTVPDEGGQTWALTITSTGNGNVTKSPNKTNYDDGDSVLLTAAPMADWYFWKHKIGSSFSNADPLSLLMDSDKSIEYIFGYKTFDHTFDESKETYWTRISRPFIAVFQSDGVYTEGTAVGSQYFYTPLMYITLNQMWQNPVLFNRMRIYYDSNNLNFYVNARNILDNSTASSGEITSSSEPVFTKTFTELKYSDQIDINVGIFNTTFCSLKITKIILDIV